MYITTSEQFEKSFNKTYEMMEIIMNCDMKEDDKKILFNHFMMDFYHCGYNTAARNLMLTLLDKVIE